MWQNTYKDLTYQRMYDTISSLRYQNEFRQFIERLPLEVREDVTEAFYFAKNAHQGQYRKSGEPFISHPLKVAILLWSFLFMW